MNFTELKEQFDRVIVRYAKDQSAAVVLLIKGLKAFTGVAYMNPADGYNRKLGRSIALGRALHQFNINEGKATDRKRTRRRPTEFTIESDDVVLFEELLVEKSNGVLQIQQQVCCQNH